MYSTGQLYKLIKELHKSRYFNVFHFVTSGSLLAFSFLYEGETRVVSLKEQPLLRVLENKMLRRTRVFEVDRKAVTEELNKYNENIHTVQYSIAIVACRAVIMQRPRDKQIYQSRF
jgi:hypothetical protein